MGVRIGEATGEHVALLECRGCGDRFETDETQHNDCPHCGHHNTSPDVIDGGDPSNWRPDGEPTI